MLIAMILKGLAMTAIVSISMRFHVTQTDHIPSIALFHLANIKLGRLASMSMCGKERMMLMIQTKGLLLRLRTGNLSVNSFRLGRCSMKLDWNFSVMVIEQAQAPAYHLAEVVR